MSMRSTAALAFRMAGIYSLIEAAGHLSYAVSCLTSWPSAPGATERSSYAMFGATYAVTGLFLVALAYMLVLRADALASRVFPVDASDEPDTRFFGLHAFAYSVVGLALAIMGLGKLAGAVAQILAHGHWAAHLGELTRSIIETGLGIALFFGSHGLVRLWSRLRFSGLRRQMGLCMRCGYDLTGNTSGRCPECGTPLAHPAPPLPPQPQVLLREEQMSGSGAEPSDKPKPV